MSQRTNSSRRNFLKHAPLMTLAGASVFSLTGELHAARGSRSITPINLGVKPLPECPGAVLIKREKLVAVTFQCQRQGLDGVGVLTLTGCVDYRFRTPGDEEFAPHEIDLEQLAPCEAYLATTSAWLDGAREMLGPIRLYHVIMTFLGVVPGVCSGGQHFECLAQGGWINFFPSTAPFKEVEEYVDTMEAWAA